jgi:hypothetical protein
MAVTKADSVYQAPELETGYICILTKPSIPGMRLSVLADKFPRFSHPGQGWISPAPSAQNPCTPDSLPATIRSGAPLPPRSGQDETTGVRAGNQGCGLLISADGGGASSW